MNELLLTDWISIIAAVVMVTTAVSTILNIRRTGKKDTKADAETLAKISKDIEYIRLELIKLQDIPRQIGELKIASDFHQRQINCLNTQFEDMGKKM